MIHHKIGNHRFSIGSVIRRRGSGRGGGCSGVPTRRWFSDKFLWHLSENQRRVGTPEQPPPRPDPRRRITEPIEKRWFPILWWIMEAYDGRARNDLNLSSGLVQKSGQIESGGSSTHYGDFAPPELINRIVPCTMRGEAFRKRPKNGGHIFIVC